MIFMQLTIFSRTELYSKCSNDNDSICNKMLTVYAAITYLTNVYYVHSFTLLYSIFNKNYYITYLTKITILHI